MRTKVTKRGRVSVPSKVRGKLQIGPNSTDPVKAFRGSGKKGMVQRLLKDRARDRQAEDAG